MIKQTKKRERLEMAASFVTPYSTSALFHYENGAVLRFLLRDRLYKLSWFNRKPDVLTNIDHRYNLRDRLSLRNAKQRCLYP